MEKWSFQKNFQHHTVSWYHHYIQQPGHTRLKETFRAVMHWKGMRNTKRHKHKYGKLPTKSVITNPWDVLYVDIIGPYTIKHKNGTVIDFMCLTMIARVSRWFDIVHHLQSLRQLFPWIQKGVRAKRPMRNLS
eukprot:CCRYP_011700-RA/>CCRYP_011700-RA protein AED:0.33 eAED:0.33 QI:0/0/0/1/0/0/2/0/132